MNTSRNESDTGQALALAADDSTIIQLSAGLALEGLRVDGSWLWWVLVDGEPLYSYEVQHVMGSYAEN
jgi:hypothetical protein